MTWTLRPMSASGIMAGTTMDIRIGTQVITAIAEGSIAIGITATAAGIIIEEAPTPLPGSAKTCASSSRSWSALAAVHSARRPLSAGSLDTETSLGTDWIFQRLDRIAWQREIYSARGVFPGGEEGKAGRIPYVRANRPSRFTRAAKKGALPPFLFYITSIV
jgi:hypothetical protein